MQHGIRVYIYIYCIYIILRCRNHELRMELEVRSQHFKGMYCSYAWKSRAKKRDVTGPLTQRCSITSLKIIGIVTCPCLHGQFTEGEKCLLSRVYISFCCIIFFFFFIAREGVPATN
jgi:hypothetical protein